MVPKFLFGLNCGATGAIIGAAVIGAGATAYGSSQQSKAMKNAAKSQNDANSANTYATNSYNWNNYLMNRGVNPLVEVAPGELPQKGNYQSVNTKLPLWAKWSTSEGISKTPTTTSA
jgi:hypothetical protein